MCYFDQRLVELVDKLTAEKDCKILIYAKDKEKCLNLNYELKRHLDLEVLDFRKEEHCNIIISKFYSLTKILFNVLLIFKYL